jgi:hypothetical protein
LPDPYIHQWHHVTDEYTWPIFIGEVASLTNIGGAELMVFFILLSLIFPELPQTEMLPPPFSLSHHPPFLEPLSSASRRRPPLPKQLPSLRSRMRTTAEPDTTTAQSQSPTTASSGCRCCRPIAAAISDRAPPCRRVALNHRRATIGPPSQVPLERPTPLHGSLSWTPPRPLSRTSVHHRCPVATARCLTTARR